MDERHPNVRHQSTLPARLRHYKGHRYAWDVVNEAIDDNGNYRTDVFYNVMGTSHIPLAFSAAAEADPNAKLYYNDYNIEYAGAKAHLGPSSWSTW